MEWVRLPNETDNELIYRICELKDDIGTWSDVADILNHITGHNYGESAYRKKYSSFSSMFNANRGSLMSGDAYSEEIREKEEALKKERMKLQTINAERNKTLRTEARRELFYENIGQYVKTLPVPEYRPITASKDCSENSSYILTIADIHYGAVFQSVNNTYSPDICRDRFERLTRETILFIKKNQVKELIVLDLGDDVQGCLRMSDLKLNDSSVVKAVVEVSRLIAQFLNQISAHTKVVYYHVPTSNHTQLRMIGMKPNECSDEDVEYIISNYIHDMLALNERVTVYASDDKIRYGDYIIFPVCGVEFDICAGHGHLIKNPQTALKDVNMLTGRDANYLMLGHLHTGKIFTVSEGYWNDNEVIYSPSIIGSDPYADKLMVGAKAAACIYEFVPTYGHTNTYKIMLCDD